MSIGVPGGPECESATHMRHRRRLVIDILGMHNKTIGYFTRLFFNSGFYEACENLYESYCCLDKFDIFGWLQLVR